MHRPLRVHPSFLPATCPVPEGDGGRKIWKIVHEALTLTLIMETAVSTDRPNWPEAPDWPTDPSLPPTNLPAGASRHVLRVPVEWQTYRHDFYTWNHPEDGRLVLMDFRTVDDWVPWMRWDDARERLPELLLAGDYQNPLVEGDQLEEVLQGMADRYFEFLLASVEGRPPPDLAPPSQRMDADPIDLARAETRIRRENQGS